MILTLPLPWRGSGEGEVEFTLSINLLKYCNCEKRPINPAILILSLQGT
jgi:hypothetical protein